MNGHCSAANAFGMPVEHLPISLSQPPYGIIIVRYETVHDMRSKPLHRKRNF